MKQGVSGDSVKELQSLLAQDKTIYPEGLVTGYFGSLTKEAVKKLERKLGLSQTGEVNENVKKFIYPCYELKVAEPNGGESFPVGDVMGILWELKSTTAESLNNQSSSSSVDKMMILPRTWSIDLISDEVADYRCMMKNVVGLKCPPTKKVVYHIQTLSLKGNSGSYEWTIPSTIPESKSYKIKVSLQAGGSPCPPGSYCAMNFMPSWTVEDESDGVFAILGGQPEPTPTTSVTPLPTATPQPDLIKIRNEVTEMIKKLQEILEKLNALLGL
jgi:peptidoglycan hydrolase-like protein with peptidoglycan-binding domain